MSEVDLSNPDAAKIWFAAQEASTKCTVASRSAIRVLPNIIVVSEGRFNTIALAAFRALLTAASFGSKRIGIAASLSSSSLSARLASNETAPGGFAFGSDVDAVFAVRDAVRAAAYSAKSKSDDFAYEAIISSANSAQHANNLRQDAASFEGAVLASIFGAATADAKKLSQRVAFGPLWDAVDIPVALLQNNIVFVEQLAGEPDWTFWRRWYLSMWDGTWTDWDLAHEVAKIENDVWEGEDALAKVAARIREIEANLLQARAPQAEQVLFDQTTQKFTVEPIDVAKPDLLGATLIQLEDALEDVLASASNGLQETAREVRVVRRVIEKHGNNPQQIEMGCVSAHAGLTRQIAAGELPPSEENLAFQAALEETAVGIRATHSDVAENRKILTQQKISEISKKDREELEKALPLLVAISDADLADDWSHDIPALVNSSVGPLPSGAPALPGADEANRLFSRVAKISIWMRMGKVIHAIDGSAVYKGGRIAVTIAGLVAIGLRLFALI